MLPSSEKTSQDYTFYLLELATGEIAKKKLINNSIVELVIKLYPETDVLMPAMCLAELYTSNLDKIYKVTSLLSGDHSFPASGDYAEYHRNVIIVSGCKYPALDAPAFVRAVALLLTLFSIAQNKGIIDKSISIKEYILANIINTTEFN